MTSTQAATFTTGQAITYLGSMWTVPAEGWVVRDTGEAKVAIEVWRPYYDAFAPETVSLKVRRTSITPR